MKVTKNSTWNNTKFIKQIGFLRERLIVFRLDDCIDGIPDNLRVLILYFPTLRTHCMLRFFSMMMGLDLEFFSSYVRQGISGFRFRVGNKVNLIANKKMKILMLLPKFHFIKHWILSYFNFRSVNRYEEKEKRKKILYQLIFSAFLLFSNAYLVS